MPKKVAVVSDRAYHHGNLRKALLDAALALLKSGEKQGVSLRTAAAHAGVSSAAPYRHFQDREALLAAVAAIGFERLLKAMTKASAAAREEPKLMTMARAYLGFASHNKGLYQLMFTENHLAVRHDEALAKSSSAAFAELEKAVSAIERDGGVAKLVATAMWSTMHGVAMLASERLIPAGGPPDEKETHNVSLAVARLTIESLLGKSQSAGS